MMLVSDGVQKFRRLLTLSLFTLAAGFTIVLYQNCVPDTSAPSQIATRSTFAIASLPQSHEFEAFTLNAGQKVVRDQLTLFMQREGNLVLYSDFGSSSQRVLWASGASGPNGRSCSGNCSASFQPAGNLVLYHGSQPYWFSSTETAAGNRLHISNEAPHISIVNGERIVWSPITEMANHAMNDLFAHFWANDASGGQIAATLNGYRPRDFPPFTLHAGEFIEHAGLKLLMQSEGNLVLYQGEVKLGNHLWASSPTGPNGLNCRGKCRAVFQPEGNLVLYDELNNPYWYNTTDSAIGNKVRLSPHFPQLSIVAADERVVWQGGVATLADHRGAPWERFMIASTIRNAFRSSGDEKYRQYFLSDWAALKRAFPNENELTYCGTNRADLNTKFVKSNWHSDDAGASAIYYLWVYEMTNDPAALNLARQTVVNAFTRWWDPVDGGLWINDTHDAKSSIASWIALASARIYELDPHNPEAHLFLNNARKFYDWIDRYVSPSGQVGAIEWQSELGPAVLYSNNVGPNGAISGYGDAVFGGVPRPGPNRCEFYLGGLTGINLLQQKLYTATRDPRYLQRAIQTANGITSAYTDGYGQFYHDCDSWADGYLLADWFDQVLALPGMPRRQAARSLRLSAIASFTKNRSQDGLYGPTWGGPAETVWTTGANRKQSHVNGNTVNVIVTGAYR
jgi:hypothetical protein